MRPLTIFLVSAALAAAQNTPAPDDDPPISNKRRAIWAVQSTVGGTAIASTAIGAGWDTLMDTPKEYTTNWDGYGRRFGLRTSATAVRTGIEAGLSAVWGEDPRYHRAAGQPFKSRLANIVKMTVMTHDSDGRMMPAYSRFVAIPASSVISNAWRPPSDTTAGNTVLRIGTGFLGRMAGNAWGEFWPDVRARVFPGNTESALEICKK